MKKLNDLVQASIPKSSKVNDYAKSSYNHRAMLLFDVYPDKKYETSRTNRKDAGL